MTDSGTLPYIEKLKIKGARYRNGKLLYLMVGYGRERWTIHVSDVRK